MKDCIKLTPEVWLKVHDQIKQDYVDTPSTYMIKYMMREVLGFTPREHRAWVPYPEPNPDGYGEYQTTIFLDFYDEQKQTYFILRYL